MLGTGECANKTEHWVSIVVQKTIECSLGHVHTENCLHV